MLYTVIGARAHASLKLQHIVLQNQAQYNLRAPDLSYNIFIMLYCLSYGHSLVVVNREECARDLEEQRGGAPWKTKRSPIFFK